MSCNESALLSVCRSYDVRVGEGQLVAVGDRVAVHYGAGSRTVAHLSLKL